MYNSMIMQNYEDVKLWRTVKFRDAPHIANQSVWIGAREEQTFPAAATHPPWNQDYNQ